MGTHDVQIGQCQTIFNTVDQDRESATTAHTDVTSHLENLIGAAEDASLSAALSRLQQEAFEPSLTAVEQRLGAVTGAGSQMLQHMATGDQEMESRATAAGSQTPTSLGAPGGF